MQAGDGYVARGAETQTLRPKAVLEGVARTGDRSRKGRHPKMAATIAVALGAVARASPNRTLLRNLSLPAKEIARRTLLLLRFREICQLFEVTRKQSALRTRTRQL